MIEAIKNIGKYAIKGDLNKDTFLSRICKRVLDKKEKYSKEDKKEIIRQYVVVLNFDTSQKNIKVNLEKVDTKSAKKYLWVGNAKANNPPINITSDKLDNILTKTFPSILNKSDKRYKSKLERIKNDFFKKLKKKITSPTRPRLTMHFGQVILK